MANVDNKNKSERDLDTDRVDIPEIASKYVIDSITEINEDGIKVIYDEDYEKYGAQDCKCGYYFDEINYQFKGRKNDFVEYGCDGCGVEFIVYINAKNKEDLKL